MERNLRSTKGISTIFLLILLILSGIVGAILSYLWTVGFYVEKEFMVPEDVTTVTITNTTFPLRNCTYFEVTVLNPSFSNDKANIVAIALVAATSDGETIFDIDPVLIEPSIPYTLDRSRTETFRCRRNWGEFAGQTIRVVIFLQEGSGPTFPQETDKVSLAITEIEIDTSKTVTQFNVTLANSFESIIPLNVTEILFDSTSIPAQNITIQNENATLPQQLQPGESKSFTCTWNFWRKGALKLENSSHLIRAITSQGYIASKTQSLPSVVSLNITDLAFNISDSSRFNVTVSSASTSPHYVNISKVTIANGSEIFNNITIVGDLPATLSPDGNITLACQWDWTAFRDSEVKITVYTIQGFYTYKYHTLPNE